jgi:hypothetical protein
MPCFGSLFEAAYIIILPFGKPSSPWYRGGDVGVAVPDWLDAPKTKPEQHLHHPFLFVVREPRTRTLYILLNVLSNLESSS